MRNELRSSENMTPRMAMEWQITRTKAQKKTLNRTHPFITVQLNSVFAYMVGFKHNCESVDMISKS